MIGRFAPDHVVTDHENVTTSWHVNAEEAVADATADHPARRAGGHA